MAKPHIAVVKYKAGNIASVSNALKRIDANFEVTNDHTKLKNADGIIFPGVGHAQAAMESVNELNLGDLLRETKKPLLGICVGMQLLFEHSEESKIPLLGIVEGTVQRFDSTKDKVPHMGWNKLHLDKNHDLFKNIDPENNWVYYVHSYYGPIIENTIASSEYIHPFSGVVANKNIMGCQFHPEKSAKDGEQFLKNFLSLV